MATPWYTSDTLIEAVKRKISFPISQSTFTNQEILDFANEEMMISQVPSVLSFHEEFFLYRDTVALEANKSHYAVPNRAIGMRLRDVFYQDNNGNLLEMTRISQDDRAYYDNNTTSTGSIHKFYVEGNDIVLTPTPGSGPTGSLLFVYYLRPNQLVTDDRAAVISKFCSQLTVVNASIVAGDTVSLGGQTFTAVSSSPSTDEFEIGASSIITATNLSTAITTNGVASATNSSSDTIAATFNNVTYTFTTSNSTAFSINANDCVQVTSVPTHFTAGNEFDFLKTDGGHRTFNIDIELQSISGTILEFTAGSLQDTMEVGDYVCSAHECIIPQIPTDLHTGLAERAASRVLAALGDMEGVSATNQKIADIQFKEGSLIDNRTEGAPQKITARNSLLRYGKMGIRRRR